ncbi:SCO family protein [Leeia oryzae]|uniref:SCO family protein n=1 Tax=Leeia oryzae TaxID=356662 RepID=UPI00036B64EC|nr:SCO family protein [Leeia oryzae]
MKRWYLGGVLLLICGLLMACSKKLDFTASDVTGGDIGGDFRLTDMNDQPRSLKDFQGKVVIVFFGYTHCPDVCPTTLGELSQVAKKMGPDFKKVQVLFVSADPERDTTKVLKDYVHLFNPDFLALRATGTAFEDFKKRYKFVSDKHQEAGQEGYSVDHSAGCYVLDATGKVRLYVPLGFGVDNWVHDLKLLLDA